MAIARRSQPFAGTRAPRVATSARCSTPLGRWVRSTRERLGVTQGQLALEANVTQRLISYIEGGERGVLGCTSLTVLGIAAAFERRGMDLSVGALLDLVRGEGRA